MPGDAAVLWASQTLPGIDDLIRQPERVEGETLTERFLRFHELRGTGTASSRPSPSPRSSARHVDADPVEGAS